MAELRDVVAYLCANYPHKQDLSKARLTKMVYLADWRSALVKNSPMTDIRWIYNYYGPFVDDVISVARKDPAFEIVQTANLFGGQKEVVRLSAEPAEWPSLTDEERQILDHVIQETSLLYWNEFIKLVYSTYPMVTQERFAPLDLVTLANEYRSKDFESLPT